MPLRCPTCRFAIDFPMSSASCSHLITNGCPHKAIAHSVWLSFPSTTQPPTFLPGENVLCASSRRTENHPCPAQNDTIPSGNTRIVLGDPHHHASHSLSSTPRCLEKLSTHAVLRSCNILQRPDTIAEITVSTRPHKARGNLRAHVRPSAKLSYPAKCNIFILKTQAGNN